MTRPSCLLTVLRAVVTALLVLSGSIAVPILCRFFYYLHIGPLGLVEQTGLSADQIRQAYNEMMDFCIVFCPFLHRGGTILPMWVCCSGWI